MISKIEILGKVIQTLRFPSRQYGSQYSENTKWKERDRIEIVLVLRKPDLLNTAQLGREDLTNGSKQ